METLPAPPFGAPRLHSLLFSSTPPFRTRPPLLLARAASKDSRLISVYF
jgi:hypothetical protein